MNLPFVHQICLMCLRLLLLLNELLLHSSGDGDRYQNPYSYQPASGAPSGSHHSGPSIHNSGRDFDYIGSCRGYAFPNTNESQSRVLPTHGGIDEVYRNYGVDDAYNHIGVESRHLLHGVTIDPSRSNTAEPYRRKSSLSYNTSTDRCANMSGGTACDLPSMRQSATPFPYGR